MKKHLRLIAAAAALALAVSAAGCGASSSSSEATSSAVLGPASGYDYQNFTYSQGLTADGHWEGVAALDYVTLPEDYAAIPLKKADIEPAEEDIQSLWDNLLESNRIQQPVTGRAAETGDIANIDYSGTVDGVVFTGGTAEGYDLTLGSGTFIPGFEDQIVGHNIGDNFDVTVTFPEDYGDSTDEAGNTITLSGKEAVFNVTLNSLAVSVLPEATDAWVEENFGESNDLHTVAEIDQYFYDNLYSTNLTNAVVDYLTENSTITSIPEVLLNYQVCSQLSYYNSYAAMFGYETLDEFLSGFMGYDTADALLADTEEDILASCDQLLIFQAVAESLDLAPTDAELEVYASYAESMGQGYVHLLALQDHVLATLRDSAVIDSSVQSGQTNGQVNVPAGVSPELVEFLNEYETFVDEYIAFMDRYQESGNAVSLLNEYLEWVQELNDFTEKANEYEVSLDNEEDVRYYIEVNSRISEKLMNAAVDIAYE